MKSIVGKGLVTRNRSKIFKTSLALTLIVFAFTMSSPSSFFQIVKPVEAAGTLSSIAILPSNNLINTRTTYDIMFKTATTGTIKTIHMTFPNSFDVSAATKYIERSGIGSGSLSSSCSISSCDLKYTVTNPVSVPAGTNIRLEIGRIINSDTAGSFKVGISTEAQVILDGPTQSPSFPIQDIIPSTSYMRTILLLDDTTGHTHGWNPDGVKKTFTIEGVSGMSLLSNFLIHINELVQCTVADVADTAFIVICDAPISDGAQLIFTVVNPPETPCCSASSLTTSTSSTNENLNTLSSSSVPTDSSQDTGSQDTGSQDTGSQNSKSTDTTDDIASEFP